MRIQRKARLFFAVSVLLYISANSCGIKTHPGKEPYVDPNPITKDTSPPFIKNVTAVSENSVVVEFSETVEEAGALSAAGYIVAGTDSALAIDTLSLDSDTAVRLVLRGSMEFGRIYSCFVQDVSDRSGNKMPGSSMEFSGRGPVLAVISNMPASVTNRTDIHADISGEDVIAYRYRLNGNTWSGERDAGASVEKAGLSEGTHVLEVIGRDSRGNWQPEAAPTRHIWSVDTTPPVASFENLPGTVTSDKDIDIVVQNAFLYKYRLDDEDWSEELNGSIVRTDIDDGSHAITVVARDAAGNWQNESEASTYSWKIDTSSPVAILSGVPAARTADRNADIYVGGEGIVSYKYSEDGGSWSAVIPHTEAISLSNLSEGNHAVVVIASNEAGTWQDYLSGTTCSWTVDITPPASIAFAAVPRDPSPDRSPVFLVEGDDVAWYTFRLDDSDWSPLISVSNPVPLADITEGGHVLRIRGADSVGNIQPEASAVSHSWTTDLTPPAALFDESSLPRALTNSRSESFIVRGVDVTQYRYSLDSGIWSADTDMTVNTFSLGSDSLTEGEHTVRIIGRDAAGNWQPVDEATAFTWTVDLTPPAAEMELLNIPPDPSGSDTVSISVTGSDSSGYQFRIDDGVWQNRDMTDKIMITGMAEGSHILEVRGFDEAGNVQEDPVSYEWRIDRTATTAVLSNVPPIVTNQTGTAVKVGGDDVVVYKFSLDGSGWSGETAVLENIILGGITAGDHVLSVIARDSAGNWQDSDEATTCSWTIDLEPPVALLSGYPPYPVNNGAVSIDVTGDDVTAYRYRLNGGAWSADRDVASPIVLTLSEASYTIQVIGRDQAGNWQGTATTASWTIDKTPPSRITVSDTGNASSITALTFSWANGSDVDNIRIQIASDQSFASVVFGGDEGAELGKVENYTYPASISSGSRYYARVKAADAAGNWSDFGTASDGIILVGSISLNVKNTSNTVIAGAVAELKNSGTGNIIQTQSTDASGNVKFDQVEAGDNLYLMDISAGGYSGAVKNNISVNVGIVSNQGIIFLVPAGASPGVFTGKVISANNGSSIAGAMIKVQNWNGTVVDTVNSASDGTFTSKSMDAGTYSLNISKDNYYSLQVDNQVLNGDKALGRQALSEVLQPYRLRVVLLWGDTPKDFDLHVVGPSNGIVTGDSPSNNRFHVFYTRKSFTESTLQYSSSADPVGSFSTTSLVQDAVQGYGPESINLFKLADGTQYADGIYTFTVHKYTSTGSWYDRPITVRIYDTQGLWQEIPFPAGAGDTLRYWKVFQVNMRGVSRSDRSLVIVNEFATLDYRSKESMDWQVAPGGLAGYLQAMGRGDVKTILLTLAVLLMLLAVTYFLNKKRMEGGVKGDTSIAK